MAATAGPAARRRRVTAFPGHRHHPEGGDALRAGVSCPRIRHRLWQSPGARRPLARLCGAGSAHRRRPGPAPGAGGHRRRRLAAHRAAAGSATRPSYRLHAPFSWLAPDPVAPAMRPARPALPRPPGLRTGYAGCHPRLHLRDCRGHARRHCRRCLPCTVGAGGHRRSCTRIQMARLDGITGIALPEQTHRLVFKGDQPPRRRRPRHRLRPP